MDFIRHLIDEITTNLIQQKKIYVGVIRKIPKGRIICFEHFVEDNLSIHGHEKQHFLMQVVPVCMRNQSKGNNSSCRGSSHA